MKISENVKRGVVAVAGVIGGCVFTAFVLFGAYAGQQCVSYWTAAEPATVRPYSEVLDEEWAAKKLAAETKWEVDHAMEKSQVLCQLAAAASLSQPGEADVDGPRKGRN